MPRTGDQIIREMLGAKDYQVIQLILRAEAAEEALEKATAEKAELQKQLDALLFERQRAENGEAPVPERQRRGLVEKSPE